MGAAVTLAEPPAGSATRRMGPFDRKGRSLQFFHLNFNKQIRALPATGDAMDGLLRAADVVVASHGFRPTRSVGAQSRLRAGRGHAVRHRRSIAPLEGSGDRPPGAVGHDVQQRHGWAASRSTAAASARPTRRASAAYIGALAALLRAAGAGGPARDRRRRRDRRGDVLPLRASSTSTAARCARAATRTNPAARCSAATAGSASGSTITAGSASARRSGCSS